MSGTVRVGIIGLGKMGLIRARELARHPHAEIVCGYDPDPAAFRVAYPDVRVLDSMEAVSTSADVDAVFVCTPNVYTPQAVIAALDAGKHVFSEKPPGRFLSDIREIMGVEARNPGLKLMFGFNHRYHAGVQEARRIVDSGRLGRLLWLRGVYGKSGGKDLEEGWRSDKEMVGAGILLDQGIHMVDLFLMLLGDIVEVKSMVTTAHWDVPVEDNAFALLRDADGHVGMLHSSSTQWKHRFNLEIYMSEGYLSVNGILSSTRSYGDETISVARRRTGGAASSGTTNEEVIYFDTDPSWELEVAEFLDNVRSDKPVRMGDSRQALKAMEVVYAIYRDDAQFMRSPSAPLET